MELTLPSHATLADAEATGTIQDDDTLLVSAIDPSSGPASGTSVTVAGESFETGATLTVGGASATGVGVPNSGQITATTPALEPGTANDVVVSIAGLTPVTLSGGFFADFLDVAGAHPFHDFVVGAARAGVTAGCGGGDYCPATSVTRAQMAVFLLKSQVRAGARAARRDRDRFRRRPAGIVRRGLDRGARFPRYHRRLRRRQLLSERPRDAGADGGLPAEDVARSGLHAAGGHGGLRRRARRGSLRSAGSRTSTRGTSPAAAAAARCSIARALRTPADRWRCFSSRPSGSNHFETAGSGSAT